MNVKTVINDTMAVDRLNKPDSAKTVKTENSSPDRDADGRRQQGEEHPRRQLNEEELQAAIENLKALEGVKKNNLTIELHENEGIKVVFIKDNQGKIVRRIPELDLWPLLLEKDKQTGQLLDKAM